MKYFVALAASAALAVTAQVVARAPNSNPAVNVEAGTYRIDPAHTEVMFTLSHLGFSEYTGRFGDATGTLQIDPKRPQAARLDVAVPIASVSTTSTKLDGELRSGDWLDAARFPEMRFTSTKVMATSAGRARVDGTLTLHGVTRPLTLSVSFVGAGMNPISKVYTTGFQATGALKRSDFGVKTYLPMIGDDITLNIAGAFEKTAS